jgi:alpha-N-arabinofuranosidase
VPLSLDGNSPQPAPRYNVGYDHPDVRAGSPTWPLDMIAGLSPDGRTLRIGIVNATLEARRVAIRLRNLKVAGRGNEWLLTAASLDAQNKVGGRPQVTIRKVPVAPLAGELAVPAKSASIFEFPVAVSH